MCVCLANEIHVCESSVTGGHFWRGGLVVVVVPYCQNKGFGKGAIEAPLVSPLPGRDFLFCNNDSYIFWMIFILVWRLHS